MKRCPGQELTITCHRCFYSHVLYWGPSFKPDKSQARVVEFLGILSLLLFFEFITDLIYPYHK